MSKVELEKLAAQYERMDRELERIQREISPIYKTLMRSVKAGETFAGKFRILKVFVRRAWIPSFWRKSFRYLTVKRV